MPFVIREDGPDSKPFCVYKKDSGEKMGCHESEKKAKDQITAINISEAGRSKEEEAPPVQESLLAELLKETFAPVLEAINGLKELLATKTDVLDVLESMDTQEEQKEEADPIPPVLPTEPTQLVVFKQEDGRFRWVGMSSTAFVDKDQEIVSIEALEKISTKTQGDFGPLLLWHLPNVDLASCDFRLQDGVCLVESGLWHDNEVSTAVRKAVSQNPAAWGMSIRFSGSLLTVLKDVIFKGRIIKNIWRDINIKERSLLPAVYASNRYSSFSTGGNEMDDTKKEAIRQLFQPEVANQIITNMDSLNVKAKEGSDVFKEVEATEDQTPVETPPTQEPVQKEERPTEDNSRVIAEVLEVMKQLATQVTALQDEVKELKADAKPRAADLLHASHDKETVDQEATKQVEAQLQQQVSPMIASMTEALTGQMRGE